MDSLLGRDLGIGLRLVSSNRYLSLRDSNLNGNQCLWRLDFYLPDHERQVECVIQ
ncbi:hypothetical protein VS_II1069 [Vibrio atlanticus]|uniref:Uncharacterized protein n=1 Tax=Vibrio atlanticus (strain LGP32) TaxID=575788 RepID=B7VS50_VIBA3|nr:hypothetical protein VS_II1069 [Vibrio atlanticus]